MRALRVAGVTLFLASAALAPVTAQITAQQRPQNRIALEQYLDWEEVSEPAALARRNADPLQPPLGRQDERPLGIVDLVDERRRHAPARAGAGIRRAVVAGRQAHRVHRQGRAERLADLRAVHGRRGRGDTDLASHRIAVGARVVARRKVDRVQR